MRVFYFILTICLFLYSNVVSAQVTSDIEVRVNKELEKKNIPEEEVRERLIQRGYDPDNIKPEQALQYKSILEEIIKEIEEERKATNTSIEVDTIRIPRSSIDTLKNDTIVEIDRVIPEQEIEPSKSLIYGHHIFNGKNINLIKGDKNLNVPDSYILSTGDEIQVTIFGASQVDFNYTISESGYIKTQSLGKIFLKGLTVAEAKKVLGKRFSRGYRFLPEQFLVTVLGVRPVSINIYGEVNSPGTYRISGANNGLNALMAAGGVTNVGSVRNIKLVKANSETKIIDVYRFLTDPVAKYEYALDDGDMIYVPLAERIVAIDGGVRRPMQYEMKEGETIKDLLFYAGGLLPEANEEIAEVVRKSNGQLLTNDVNLSSSFELSDGDQVMIKKQKDFIPSYVKITGEVKFPGNYQYTNGITLKDILGKARLTDLSREDIAYIFRHQLSGSRKLERITLVNQDDIVLNVQDEVLVLSVREFSDADRTISIFGAVRKPDTLAFNPADRIRISDLVMLAGGLKENASPDALVTRVSAQNEALKEYFKIDLFDILNNVGGQNDLILEGGESIQVFQNERYNELGKVTIVGAVLNPLETQYDMSMSLNKLLLMAGGPNRYATDIGMIRRKATDNDKEYTYIKFSLSDIKSGTDISLALGDEVRIYDNNTYVDGFDIKVYGEVNNPGEFYFDKSLKLEDAIYMAGGLTFRASTDRVEVYRLDVKENLGTKILIKNLALERKENGQVSLSESFELEPFDIVIVRPMPDFDLQEVVYLNGQVKFPGPYILTNKNERLSDIVARAGGLKIDAFPAGATMVRKRGDLTGNVFIELDKAIGWKDKNEDIVLRGGDIVFIPKRENVVSIKTKGTRAALHYSEDKTNSDEIQFAYQGRKSAKWYIDHFAGGLADDVDKKSIRVIGPSGRVEGTRRYLWFIYDYPTVVEGSTIAMNYKRPEPEKEAKPIDWSKTITDIMAIVSSAVTIVVLATRIN